ncbi:MAG: tetratricopeptide repeat protein [Sphingomonadaceae bacterium]
MIWLPVILLAAIGFVVGVFALRVPRSGRAILGAALLVGLAGYAWQGHPGYAGSPTAAHSELAADGGPMVDARRAMFSPSDPPAPFVTVADGFTRRGQFQNAAGILNGALAENPKDGEAWLALGNTLVSHAGGTLTPAAMQAFMKAEEYLPDHPAPDYFLGVAMIRSGRLVEARALWSKALAETPSDAPWRAELADRLNRLDALMGQLSQ